MKKNYFELKEKRQQLKCYYIILCDLNLLIEHCIKYNVEYDQFKNLYFCLEKRYDEIVKTIKELECDN
ncbi:MAG: hypothetical protein SPJ27_09815 [Candidatus Onthovivens sp.]|nr:hypothetical protein [Candidatus Onthovivens sp.]